MPSEYERESLRLSKLTRAERFEELLSFPNSFAFKAIGRGERFRESVRSLLDTKGHGGVVLMERPSKNGTFLALTFTLEMESGAAIDAMYTALEALDDLAYLL